MTFRHSCVPQDVLELAGKTGSESPVKVAFASLIGSAIEWYDFFLYGTAAALIFNKLFFPTFDPTIGTLLSFATFALGFRLTPLGIAVGTGVLLGPQGGHWFQPPTSAAHASLPISQT